MINFGDPIFVKRINIMYSYTRGSPRGFKNPNERKLEILPTIINNLVLFIYVLTIDPITLPVLVLQLPLNPIIV